MKTDYQKEKRKSQNGLTGAIIIVFVLSLIVFLMMFVLPRKVKSQNPVVEAFTLNCSADSVFQREVQKICKEKNYTLLMGHYNNQDPLSTIAVAWRMEFYNVLFSSVYINGGGYISTPTDLGSYENVLSLMPEYTNTINAWAYLDTASLLTVMITADHPDMLIGVLKENLENFPNTVRKYLPDPNGIMCYDTISLTENISDFVIDSTQIVLFTYNNGFMTGEFDSYVKDMIDYSGINQYARLDLKIWSYSGCLYIKADKPLVGTKIYSIDGRFEKTINSDRLFLSVPLPTGIYIVNDKKIIIY